MWRAVHHDVPPMIPRGALEQREEGSIKRLEVYLAINDGTLHDEDLGTLSI